MLKKNDLLSLEDYEKRRSTFRKQIIALRQIRSVALGKHIRLLFENRQTIKYQIQEMLRIEKIFTQQGIKDELDTYNPLIPSGTNLKSTLMIEYSDPNERKEALARLIDIEQSIYFDMSDNKVFAICNEDLVRQTEEKTAAVHFMRFEFDTKLRQNFTKQEVRIITNHPHYQTSCVLSSEVKRNLAQDFVV